ncbi:hypothetical protein Q8G41_27320, partial [Klebsiella pneumoniae]|uniref:hypothetical protein n=1 Tax=Klebsiella pneumoniae TaxID=573 RepID=UPI00301397F7
IKLRMNPGLTSRTAVATTRDYQKVELERKQFSECINVRRELTRIVMSYCQPLREAMRDADPEKLIRTIRDAMIVYYNAYKSPKNGFLHGDIS